MAQEVPGGAAVRFDACRPTVEGCPISAVFSGPASTNLLILAGLIWTAAVCWRLLGPAGDRPPRGPGWWRKAVWIVRWRPHVVPQALVGLGFWLSASSDTFWTLLVVAGVGVLTSVAIMLLRPRRDLEPSPAALAVVVATAGLVQFGGLLLIRLVVVRDPDDPFGSGLRSDAWSEGWSALLQPLLFFAFLLAGFWLVRRAPVAAKPVQAMRTWSGSAASVPSVVVGIASVLTLLLFFVPLLGPVNGEAHLVFLGVATPEFGKITFLAVLALLISRYGYNFFGPPAGPRLARPATVPRLRWWYAEAKSWRYLAYPLGLFVATALLAIWRKDLGTLIPLLCAMVTMTWLATLHVTGRGGSTKGAEVKTDLRRAFRSYRAFAVVFAVFALFGVAGVLVNAYTLDRAKVWQDPWQYRWDSGCVPVAQAPVDAAGVRFCQESMLANREGARSQVAKALAAVADGGLWGRGLHDSASSVVPVGSTDFVLAVIWDKLGGLVVLLLVALIALLAVALHRSTGPPPPRGAHLPPWRLFAAGLAAMIIGQFFFVFAATLNFIPHSGIPAPFLSRGGQSTFALLAAIAVVLAAAAPGVGSAPVQAVRRRPLGALPLLAACLVMVAVVTVFPYAAPHFPVPDAYAADRPPCALRSDNRESLLSAQPDPAKCSTDRIAYDRTRVEVDLQGHPVLRQVRPGGGWEIVGGTLPGGLVLTDLSGLVQVPGGGTGLVDQSFPEVFDGSVGASLGRRLSLPGDPARAPADGSVDLTIDPGLQHTLASLMDARDAGAGVPLAGGAVLLDATSGRILAATSTPVVTPVPTVPGDAAAAEKWLEDHPEYAKLGPAGALDGAGSAPTCPATTDPAVQADCWRWQYNVVPAPDDAARKNRLRAYVGGDASITQLPDPAVDRALGKWYGLGSTFKVVIASAYLRREGTGPDDRISAPATVFLADDVIIHNAGGGECAGTQDGTITLRQALAVSCNTAFVQLARDLGWPAIAEQAARFGLTVGDCDPDDPDPWPTRRLRGSAASCVPSDVDDVAIGNAALGGGPVQGTPLAMASIMATVANGGVAVQPTLVSGVRTPSGGQQVLADPKRTEALPPAVAGEVTEALTDVADFGTAHGLKAAVGVPVWVKTGTHEVVPAGQALPRGQFVRVYSWIAGFVRTPRGTFAFAVVAETRDEAVGGKRVRYVAQHLIETLKGRP